MAQPSSDCGLMYVKVKSGGCSGRIVVTGGKPKCVALLSDELRAWRFLQKLNYKRRDGIQQTALTMQLFCTVTSSENAVNTGLQSTSLTENERYRKISLACF